MTCWRTMTQRTSRSPSQHPTAQTTRVAACLCPTSASAQRMQQDRVNQPDPTALSRTQQGRHRRRRRRAAAAAAAVLTHWRRTRCCEGRWGPPGRTRAATRTHGPVQVHPRARAALCRSHSCASLGSRRCHSCRRVSGCRHHRRRYHRTPCCHQTVRRLAQGAVRPVIVTLDISAFANASSIELQTCGAPGNSIAATLLRWCSSL